MWRFSLVLFQVQSVVLLCDSQRELQNIGESLRRRLHFSPLFKLFEFKRRFCVSPDEQQHRWWKTGPSASEVLQFGTSSHEVEAPHCPRLFLQVAQIVYLCKNKIIKNNK